MEGQDLVSFLTRLGEDAELLDRFKGDPYGTMDAEGVAPSDQDLLRPLIEPPSPGPRHG